MYDDLTGIDKDWIGIKSFIKVYRKVEHKGKINIETSFFISSLLSSTTNITANIPISTNAPAKFFGKGIRYHWHLESFHWIKDVTFKEDASKVTMKNAPENYSLLRNVCINMFRNNGFPKIQATTEKCANNVAFMFQMF